ncbi:MAG: CotH kinase family protein [Planctomycetales bacterium]|nr:CotH kinase family protein [Planctomycetales bacterium]
MLAGNLVVSEFLAANDTGIRDYDNDTSDWIELLNNGDEAVELFGWHLTDDASNLTKWTVSIPFPLNAQQRVVVFASGKDKLAPNGEMHANFQLASNGEYLALVEPDGLTVAWETAPEYPPQFEDVSYGQVEEIETAPAGVAVGDLLYFGVPTPGDINFTPRLGVAPTPEFSHAGGTFQNSLDLTLSTEVDGATIRYTLDGTLPNESSPIYDVSISVTQSTRVRAAVFHPDLVTSETRTENYVLLNSDLIEFSSDLPVIVLDSFSTTPNTSTAVFTSMSLYEPAADGRTRLTDAATLESRSTLKIRGSSSSGFPQKQYALELWKDDQDDDRNVSLLGMPSDSDWILQAPASFDRSLMHNTLIYELSNQIGQYAVRTRYVEVFLNQRDTAVPDNDKELATNDYVGVYMLMEKIKLGSDRVDVEKISPQYTSDEELSGGYIFKVDRLDPGDGGFNVNGQGLAYVEPKETEIEANPAQATYPGGSYIAEYMKQFADAVAASDFHHPTLGLHYSEWIDVQSFIDHFLINELAYNVDAFRLSAYYYKPRSGKVVAGPAWDFDRSLESAIDGRDNNPLAWYSSGPVWWGDLFNDVDYRQTYIDRWADLRQHQLSNENLFAVVEQMAAQVTEASDRHFARWTQTPPRTSDVYNSGQLDGTWRGEVEHMKAWIAERVAWLDSVYVNAPQFDQAGGIIPPSSIITLTAPAGAEIYYTTDGSDPRLPGGEISPAAVRYNGGIIVSENTFITARAYDEDYNSSIPSFTPGNEPWSPPSVNAFSTQSPPPVTMTEVNYNPHEPTSEELSINAAWTAESFEYVEIQNTGSGPVNLIGSQFTDGFEFRFSSFNLAAGDYAVIVRDPAAFRARYGTDPVIAGQFATGGLSNGGENLRLEDVLGTVIDEFQYDSNSDWPPRADGHGSTLERIDPQGDLNAPETWADSVEFGGSPGRAPQAAPFSIVVNEVLAHTDLPQVDSIELLNTGLASVSLGGWYLSDSNGNYRKFHIPDDVVLPPGGFVVFDEDDFNQSLGIDPNDFALSSAHGDELFLLSTDAQDRFTFFAAQVEFGATANGESIGRVPGSGNELVPLVEVTLGAENSAPRVGPALITEVMYQPADPDGPGGIEPDDLEFVEIYNPTTDPIDLTEWRLRRGVDIDFPAGQMLAPAGVLVAVSFDPTLPENAARLSNFRTFYGIDASVDLVGGFSGRLNDLGERVQLQRPDDPPAEEPDFYPRLLEDQVTYNIAEPWPLEAAGGGLSLTRLGPERWGDDAASWYAAEPSPGTFVDLVSTFQIFTADVLPTGVSLRLLRDPDLAKLNLYDGIDPTPDLPDIELVGAQVGQVTGSLIWHSAKRTLEFVRTGAPLAPDDYTLLVRSKSDGLIGADGALLDGDRNGSAGGDYQFEFSIEDATDRWLTLTDFARGPRQLVDINHQGLPVSISNGVGLTKIEFLFHYDPSLLLLFSSSKPAGLPADWTVDPPRLVTSGVARIVAQGDTPLPSGPATIASLSAVTGFNAPHNAEQVLRIDSVIANDGAINVAGDSAVQKIAYLGDATDSDDYSGLDAALIARVIVGHDTGFDAFARLDPVILADASGNGRLSALDASFVARRAVGEEQEEIPPIPGAAPPEPPPSVSLADQLGAETAPAAAPPAPVPLNFMLGFTANHAEPRDEDDQPPPNAAPWPGSEGTLADTVDNLFLTEKRFADEERARDAGGELATIRSFAQEARNEAEESPLDAVFAALGDG